MAIGGVEQWTLVGDGSVNLNHGPLSGDNARIRLKTNSTTVSLLANRLSGGFVLET